MNKKEVLELKRRLKKDQATLQSSGRLLRGLQP